MRPEATILMAVFLVLLGACTGVVRQGGMSVEEQRRTMAQVEAERERQRASNEAAGLGRRTDVEVNSVEAPGIAEQRPKRPVTPPAAGADEPKGVELEQGMLEWGASREAARFLVPSTSKIGLFCSSTLLPPGVESCRMSDGGIDFGDGRRMAQLYFHEDRFYRWEMPFPPDRYLFIADALRGRLGKATADRESKIQNRMGATFDQRVQEWKGKSTLVRVSMRGRDGKVDVGEVVVIYSPIANDVPEPKAKVPF